ncbi:MAG: hypothetical protein CL872_04690 [Dehalococcoidaceae bacterium]|nr:hypothetical protein [Dehalococcoidaceae bacterium]
MSENKCPLFSEKLELHMVEVGNGLRPNAGSFCDFCFNPIDLTGSKINKCTNCNKNIAANNTVGSVPDEIFAMLREVRKIERTYVISFAFLGIFLSLITGFLIVFNTTFLYSNEILGTIILFAYLLITGRLLANIFGGIIGDQIGYKKGRDTLELRWSQWKKNNH